MNNQFFVIMLFLLSSTLAYSQLGSSLLANNPGILKRGITSFKTIKVKTLNRRGECKAGGSDGVCLAKREKTNTVTHNHKLIKITNSGRDKGQYVVSQGYDTKSCNIIAIFNILLLRGDIKIDRARNPTISDAFMVKELQDYLDKNAPSLKHIKAWIPTLLKNGLDSDKDIRDATIFKSVTSSGKYLLGVKWIERLFAIVLTQCRSF
jgi:hypothetical protein